jgi:hypothetical protein
MADENLSTSRLVLIPALITLAVTVLRLVGELNHWNEALFNRKAGGGGALIGISWLALVFAVYFAVRLQNEGHGPERTGAAIGYTLAALGVAIAGMFVFFFGVQKPMRAAIWVGLAIMAASLWVMRRAWPAYWRVMIDYALWARVPVIVVMFFAIMGNWGTHYDVAPPSGDIWGSDWFRKWFEIGVIPQIFLWVPYTVVLCGLAGIIVAAVRKATRPAPASA